MSDFATVNFLYVIFAIPAFAKGYIALRYGFYKKGAWQLAFSVLITVVLVLRLMK